MSDPNEHRTQNSERSVAQPQHRTQNFRTFCILHSVFCILHSPPEVHIPLVLPVLVGAWSIVLMAGCGSGPKPVSKATAGRATVTYKDDVTPITHMFCRCHIDNPTPPGAYDLTSYEQAMKPGRSGIQIRPGNPDSSGLYQRAVIGTMPPTARLAAADLRILHDWIQQGTQNN